MPNPMTIDEARSVDLDVGPDAVAEAEAEADEARQLVEALERQAVEGKGKPKNAAQAAEAKQLHEFAVKRAARTRNLADKAKAARRLLDLEAVGKTVEEIHAAAAQPGDGMVKAMQQIADSSAALRQLVDAHNGKVLEAVDRAKQLGAEPPAPNGPRASSAHISVRQRQIQSGFTTVQTVDGKTVNDAIELAVKGDHEAAVRKLHAAHRQDPPKRADHYYLFNSQVFEQGDGTRRDGSQINTWPAKVAKGEARELSDDEVEAYLNGRFDGYQAQA